MKKVVKVTIFYEDGTYQEVIPLPTDQISTPKITTVGEQKKPAVATPWPHLPAIPTPPYENCDKRCHICSMSLSDVPCGTSLRDSPDAYTRTT